VVHRTHPVIVRCAAPGRCLTAPANARASWPMRARRPWIDQALARGNTLRQPSCVHRLAGLI